MHYPHLQYIPNFLILYMQLAFPLQSLHHQLFVTVNDEKMNYVLNAYVKEQGTEMDGYQTAARFAGLIGACSSNSSLTHTVINGFTEILERLTNSQIVTAEKKGCLVLTYNSQKQVWIDTELSDIVHAISFPSAIIASPTVCNWLMTVLRPFLSLSIFPTRLSEVIYI